jgi:hypothetical protein
MTSILNGKCDIAILPFYQLALARSMVEIIPTNVIIFMHTNYYGAKSVGDLFTQEGSQKTFVALQDGPYNP